MSIAGGAKLGSIIIQAKNASGQDGVFIPFGFGAKACVFVYFIFWRFVPEIANLISFWDVDPGMAITLFILRFVRDVLTLYPFLSPSIGGTVPGWLHPLVLPQLLDISNSFVRTPLNIALPLTCWFSPQGTNFEHAFLGSISPEANIDVKIKHALLEIIGLLSLYVGFKFVSSSSRGHAGVRNGGGFSEVRLLLVVLVCFLAFVLLISQSGGLVAHFSSLALGRARMGQDVGHYLVLIRFLPYALIFWYILDNRRLQSFLYLGIFLLALVVTFAATGSRTGIFWPVITLMIAWMLVNKRVPAIRVILIGVIGFLALGVLGQLRNSAGHNGGQADFNLLAQVSLSNAVENSEEVVALHEAVSGGVAVLHTVPRKIDWLYGDTYLGALLFFVPRSVWPSKPRSVGAYVGALIYEHQKSAAGFLGTGYPMPAEIEAYWNFGYLGPIMIFFIYGCYLKLVSRKFASANGNPFFSVFFIITLMSLPDPGSVKLVPYFQLVFLLLFTWTFIRIRLR